MPYDEINHEFIQDDFDPDEAIGELNVIAQRQRDGMVADDAADLKRMVELWDQLSEYMTIGYELPPTWDIIRKVKYK